MNVLIIAQYFPPDIGGSSTRAFNVAKGLKKQGYTIKVVTAFPHYPHGKISPHYKGRALIFELRDDIEITRVWIPSLPHNSLINRIILHICFIFTSLLALPFEGSVDVIFAANPNLFSFFPALIYGFVKRKPIIRNVDDLWPEVFYDMNLVKSNILKKLLDFMAWLSYTLPLAITPISSSYKQRIIKKYKVKNEKIKVIEVGVDTLFFSKTIFSKKKKNFIVMYSGILGPAYDFKNVLTAAKLLSNYKEIKFYIRGIGEYEHYIRKIIDEFSLKNVYLDTNIVPKLKLIEILNLADVFLLPMKEIEAAEEGLPTKIFEYQALGKAIICCSRGEPAKYLNFTQSGLVVQPGDPKALASTILGVFKDNKLRKTLGMNGKNYVSKNFTVEKIGERFNYLFSSIGIIS